VGGASPLREIDVTEAPSAIKKEITFGVTGK
jgi:hypothetical protein